jgi:hypothetical protein
VKTIWTDFLALNNWSESDETDFDRGFQMKHKSLNFILLSFVCLFAYSCSPTSSNFSVPSSEVNFTGAIELNKKVDILFVIDNTSSMLQHQKRIAGQLKLLTDSLNSLKMDYRFAVTTTSMGLPSQSCPDDTRSLIGQPAYLTEKNIGILQDRFLVGKSGCDLERGLDAMALVISKSYLESINSDFIRDDALLVVNFISDEEDKSNEFGNSSTDDFIRILNQRKPSFKDGSQGWIANLIGTINPLVTCDQLGAIPNVGNKYLKLVDYSNGVKSSICNLDMSTSVSNIKSRIIGQLTTYRFQDEPDKATIDVSVGDRRIFEDETNGWTLDIEFNKFILRFNGNAIPKADEKVRVIYTPKRPR